MVRGEVPARARELAARLSALFVADSTLAERLNDAQRRLQHANDRLWSGLHPDALGLIYDGGDRDGRGASAVAEQTIAALRSGGQQEAESGLVQVLQQTHWAIHRAFVDFQSGCEERRRLAVDVGELSERLTRELTAVGWSERAAQDANAHELAAGRR